MAALSVSMGRFWESLAPNTRGAAWMLLSAVLFTAMAVLIKFLGQGYSAPLQTFYRQIAGFVILLPLIARRPGVVRTTRPGILLFRATAGTVGLILSFYGFAAMPLAQANALSFTRTLWLVPLAAFVVREHVGLPRVAAAVVGFLGVLVMIGAELLQSMHVGWPAAAMLASSFLFALTVTGMKVLTRDHSPSTLLVWSAALGAVFALPGAFFAWRWPTLLDLGLLTAMGAIGTINQYCYVKGMSIGDAGAMAPIDYTRLVFAAIAGFVLFSEIPTLWTLLGAAIVVASTLYITWREQRAARLARAA
jgi:drug/metabolite transporter (DMT)-like permease